MDEQQQELLLALLFGEPSVNEQELDEAHALLQQDPEQMQEYLELKEIRDLLALSAPECAPPDSLRQAILLPFDGVQRYAMYAERIAELFSCSVEKVMSLFGLLDTEEEWSKGPAKETHLLHAKLDSEPKGTWMGFIRLQPGCIFPTHRHLGREHLLILTGGYTNDAGDEFWPGDEDANESGTVHGLVVHKEVACIAALISENGFKIV